MQPTSEAISKRLAVPLYYTGLTKTALISGQSSDRRWARHALSRSYRVQLKVALQPQSLAYFIVKQTNITT